MASPSTPAAWGEEAHTFQGVGPPGIGGPSETPGARGQGSGAVGLGSGVVPDVASARERVPGEDR
eukprot:12280605-Alexandrium_andersonii.AAC.1